jgi:putative membrane protein
MRQRRWRSVSLAAGIAVAAFAVSPPMDERADATLTAHMVQHMLLGLVAPALVVIGSPLLLLLGVCPRPVGRRLVRLGHARWAAFVTAPLLGLLLLPGVQLVLHTTGLFELAVEHEPIHIAEHAVLFCAGLLFWRPVLGADPVPRLHPWAQVAYLLIAMPLGDVVGVWLMASRGIEYPAYAAPGLADQHRAGAVMLSGSFLLGAAALSSSWRWVQLDHRRTARGMAP